MKLYEYMTLDIGFAGIFPPAHVINAYALEGWRLIAVVQRVGNDSSAIRHYFERKLPAVTESFPRIKQL